MGAPAKAKKVVPERKAVTKLLDTSNGALRPVPNVMMVMEKPVEHSARNAKDSSESSRNYPASRKAISAKHAIKPSVEKEKVVKVKSPERVENTRKCSLKNAEKDVAALAEKLESSERKVKTEDAKPREVKKEASSSRKVVTKRVRKARSPEKAERKARSPEKVERKARSPEKVERKARSPEKARRAKKARKAKKERAE